MAGTLANTLYPPQLSTFIPAFINTKEMIIPFGLSAFNEPNEIKRVHVSVVDQKTNENVLVNPSGIFFSQLLYDEESKKYYVSIPPTSIKGGIYKINQFYKVQIRFDGYSGTDYHADMTKEEINQYLLAYRTYFSEWSTICLARPILEPNLIINNFDNRPENIEGLVGLNKGSVNISGKIVFLSELETSPKETETLQSYNIQILDGYTEEILKETPTIFTSDNIDPNVIGYYIDLQGLEGELNQEFIMRFNITTVNQYTFYKDYKFLLMMYVEDDNFDPTITYDINNDDGVINLHIENYANVFGTLIVKRASSHDGFSSWNIIKEYSCAGPIDVSFEDNTVASMVWYKYSVQLENIKGGMTNLYTTDKILLDFYDVILSRGKKQIRLQYDYKISNCKTVVNRSKTDTLGGKYPKFVENANLNYKQMSISGLISAKMDENSTFLSQSSKYGDEYNNYLTYNENNNISEFYDYYWEKVFREELESWLNDGEVKLYRSLTEGNMCVMISDFSMTPNSVLSRMIWSFTATVYEVEDGYDLDVLNSTGIYETVKEKDYSSISDPPEITYLEVEKVYQVNNFPAVKGANFLEYIMADLENKYSGIRVDSIPEDLCLRDVKIYFHSSPRPYIEQSSGLTEVKDLDSPLVQLGYKLTLLVDGEDSKKTDIFVNKKGFYQIPNDFLIRGIYFTPGDIFSIECVLVYKEEVNTSNLPSGTTLEKTLIGQYMDVFKYNQLIGDKIRAKYNFLKPNEFYQRMQYWRGICVDVEPFACFEVKYLGEKEFERYYVGETGVLHFLKDYPIEDMRFLGKITNCQSIERQKYLESWEVVLDASLTLKLLEKNPQYTTEQDLLENWEQWSFDGIDMTDKIEKPQYNTVYATNNGLYLYNLFGEWCSVSKMEKGKLFIKTSIEGMVNYFGDIIRSDYY